jgi:NHL repeat
MNGEPFHRCTHTALSPKGEIYVSDGYGNSRVHKYSPDGKFLAPHGLAVTGMVTSMSARSPGLRGRSSSRASRTPTNLRSPQKFEKVE